MMEEAMEINENNIQQDLCRLCDCECDENGEMFSIFDRNEEGLEIIHLIQECLPLVVHKTDSLSKCVCADCLENLNNLFKFKMKSIEVAKKYKETLPTDNGGHETENDQETVENDHMDDREDEKNNAETSKLVVKAKANDAELEKCDAETSTEDITILCCNCRSEILDAHKLNKEIELCNDLHQAIAESFSRNKIVTSDKMLRSRRKRSQAYYNELEDSLCSSLTEFTNTESSQCFEFQSDMDSMGEDEEERQVKRRRVEQISDPLILPVDYEKKFEKEEEYIYNPFSLLQLCLNVINKENILDYEPDDFLVEIIEPKCSYCGESYRNSKLLALHETTHMSIELGEKVDNPTLWHESRDDSYVRNKWLTSEDDVADEEDNELQENEDAMETIDFEGGPADEEEEEESLLIPVGSGEQRDGNYEVTREVNLMDGKPYVDGLPLSDYPKEERRVFYHSMRIGGVNKRFCPLCRYSFKDNWAIESHYFSMACYYTCRYCGMRFNKQRNRFDEHVDIHVRNKDEYSTKVFAASKINNVLPKVVYPKRRSGSSMKYYNDTPIPQPVEVQHFIPLNKRTLQPEGNFAMSSDQGGGIGVGSGGGGGAFKFSPFGGRVKNEQVRVKPEPVRMTQEMVRVKPEPLDYDALGESQGQYQPQLQTSQSKTGNQAFFCRKCYKVFFKLDEFNIHSKNCDFNQFPNTTMLGNYLSTGTKPPNGEPQQQQQPQPMSSSGRPMRNCAKEAGPYRDEVYIPEHILRDQVQTAQSQGPFICYICNTPFPTIYSRNSHMRIHKAENMGVTPPSTSQSPQQRHRPVYQDTGPYQTSVAHLAQVKQEPMDLEPEVEIHEQVGQDNFSANLSPAVSITPISKNPHQKPQINPSVMKLVQSNPQLSIKNREPQGQPQPQQQPLQHLPNHNQQIQQQIQQMLSGQSDVDRTYKCSSCWEAFANKSHLYFHKKNQCEGSKYPCPFCKKRFGTEAAYSSHIFYSHPE